jgi:hypothetical protein
MISGRSAAKARARDAERADHDLQTDELEGDVRHRRDDPGDSHRQGEPAVAEAPAHEVSCGDVMVLVADVPDPREHQEKDRVSDDRVGHREESDSARAKGKCRNGNESIGRVEIAADEEPGDDGTEASSAESPLVQQIEIASAPVGRREAQPGDKAKHRYEDDQGDPVDVLHRIPPSLFLAPECDSMSSR